MGERTDRAVRATTYVTETFTGTEAEVLRRYFTNLDGPVFALVNLPEVVKGALFARYSRTHKSLRRLFLDEFVDEIDTVGDATLDASVGLRRAEDLYRRVFTEYGDDSVAQLGGVHLACEQASNLLTKALEWGRLGAYLEQSTRYLAYDTRLGGRFRYHRPAEILSSPLGTRYVADLDHLFATYAELVPVLAEHLAGCYPPEPGVSDIAYRRSVRAKAFDALRGLLPAASLSNVGIYASGQSYELLVMRLRAHPLPEARAYGELILEELRKVIPSFLARVDRPDRGGEWTAYLGTTARGTAAVARRVLAGAEPEPRPEVTLVDWDPAGEEKVLAAMLYPYSDLPDDQLLAKVRAMPGADRAALAEAYVGDRANRRHKPGRALERATYRFDVLSDYGAFRDLQRHRLLTIQWQPLTPAHGFEVPPEVAAAGAAEPYQLAMARSAALHDDLCRANGGRFAAQAAYAVALGYRVRYVIELNARSALHLIELRTAPGGHAGYRRVAQEMHRLITEKAGHHLVAGMMRFADHSPSGLGRLAGEVRAEGRRRAQG